MRKYRITFNAPVTLCFVLICLLATEFGIITDGRTTQMFFMTYRASWFNLMTYVRLFTHVFGHSGWEHFASNAAYLLLLGPMLEEKYGSKNLAAVIAVTAGVTGLLNSLLFANVGLCGASGVVFAFILMSSLSGFQDHEIPVTFILVAVLFIGKEIISGIAIADNISNITHIAGGVVGGIMGFEMNSRRYH